MDDLLNIETWREILVGAFSELGSNLANFVPNFIGAIVILLVGWLFSKAVQIVASRALKSVNLETAAARLGVSKLLARAGISLSLTDIVAKLLFWLVMLTFLLSSVETLGLTAVTATIDRLIAFIPGLLGATLVLLGGMMLARFIKPLVSSAAAAAGFTSAPRLGFLAQLVVTAVIILIAFEQIGIGTDVMLYPLLVVLAAGGIAIGLAFALGSRQVINHIMAGHFLKQSLPRNKLLEIDGYKGRVERIGAVDTLIQGAATSWSIPNAQLLDKVVVRFEDSSEFAPSDRSNSA